MTFDLPNDANSIYLTFDDGPHPIITPWVLDVLEEYDAKATFFLIGQNAKQHSELLNRIISEGHSIGNHSNSHCSGWKTKSAEYYLDIENCSEIVRSNIFRPPYGQITKSQSVQLKNDYKIIMWSDLSADFDERVSVNDCVKYATHKVKSGSIIVFHDSQKAWPRLEKALPRCLDYYREQGFTLSSIPMD